jgi:hypothetical protein
MTKIYRFLNKFSIPQYSMYEDEGEDDDADSGDPIGKQRISGTDSSSGTLAGVGVGGGQSPGGGHGGGEELEME